MGSECIKISKFNSFKSSYSTYYVDARLKIKIPFSSQQPPIERFREAGSKLIFTTTKTLACLPYIFIAGTCVCVCVYVYVSISVGGARVEVLNKDLFALVTRHGAIVKV